MLTSKGITQRIETTANLSDQVPAVMNLVGDLLVTFASSDLPWDLGPPLDHTNWHHKLHRD
jgi:hypothetical protein